MLKFYDIGFIYRVKSYYKISLLKVAIIAFLRGIISKKTIQTLGYPRKTP